MSYLYNTWLYIFPLLFKPKFINISDYIYPLCSDFDAVIKANVPRYYKYIYKCTIKISFLKSHTAKLSKTFIASCIQITFICVYPLWAYSHIATNCLQTTLSQKCNSPNIIHYLCSLLLTFWEPFF